MLIKRRMLSDPPLTLWTYVTFADGALRIESVATAADSAALAVTVGEMVGWGNVPTWVEGHGFVTDRGSWAGDFIARDGLGVSYALAVTDGTRRRALRQAAPGFHEWPRNGRDDREHPAPMGPPSGASCS